MNPIFDPYLDKFVVVFIDDILVYSRSKKEHVEHLRIVLKTLEEHKLYAKFNKRDFRMEKVHLLGHVISKERLSVDPAKVEVVFNWPKPTNITEVRNFLGMVGYYHRFVECFSKLVVPLSKLSHKDNKFTRTEECETSFQELRQHLVSAPDDT